MAGRRAGKNRRAVNRTVRALKASGAIGDQHRALIEMVCTLADAVDRLPYEPQLWREYRLAVVELNKLGSDDADPFEDLITRLRSPVGNASN